ncbi:MAG: hypothetical protein WC216_05180 [Gallionella sp.]|jgi:hypothetical protein
MGEIKPHRIDNDKACVRPLKTDCTPLVQISGEKHPSSQTSVKKSAIAHQNYAQLG